MDSIVLTQILHHIHQKLADIQIKIETKWYHQSIAKTKALGHVEIK
jgi:hypothetical protein